MTYLAVVVVAAGAFVVTNLDTWLFLTAVLAVGGGRVTVPAIVGEMLGFGLVLGAVLAVAAQLGSVPTPWVGLVGAVPIAIGAVQLRREHVAGPDGASAPGTRWSILAVSAAVVSHGIDNVAVLSPLLRDRTAPEILVVSAVFVVMNAVLCLSASLVADRSRVRRLARLVGDHGLPWIYIAIGVLLVVDALHSGLG